MLTSLALILLLGMLLGSIFKKLRLPSLVGMLLAGVLLGPHALALVSGDLMEVSPELRRFALVVILTRAGLALNLSELRRVGRAAVLMSLLPALFEIGAVTLLAPVFFDVGRLDAAIMGSVLAAVSPAVIVPRMLHMIREKRGTDRGIPQMIMAAASVDDVFVIVLFTSLLGITSGVGDSDVTGSLLQVPLSIAMGLLFGYLIGVLLARFFKHFQMGDTAKVIVVLSVSFLAIASEGWLEGWIPVSGLLAVMSMGVALLAHSKDVAGKLSLKFGKLWIAAEVLLFVLVGAELDLSYALEAGLSAVLLVMCGLVFRMLGVFLSLMGTGLKMRERLFCMIAFLPKATVQAAIGGIPLSMGLACGEMVLTVAVISIVVTAPLGAFLMDYTYTKLIDNNND